MTAVKTVVAAAGEKGLQLGNSGTAQKTNPALGTLSNVSTMRLQGVEMTAWGTGWQEMGWGCTYIFLQYIFHCADEIGLTLIASTPETSIFALCPLHILRNFVATRSRPDIQLFIRLTLDLRLLILVSFSQLIRRLDLRRAVNTARCKRQSPEKSLFLLRHRGWCMAICAHFGHGLGSSLHSHRPAGR